MPDRIKHLPEDLANQIAAGEVIERPASVIKELVENAIDAESTHIVVKIEKGGAQLVSVADNGIGMSAHDALASFDRHATSKISSKEDLFNIHTLGFRGEALASIAAVARVRMKTREREEVSGTCVEIEGGKLIRSTDTGCPSGTEIEVRELFYNVPARKSFLKGPSTETGHMINILTQCALAYPEIHLVLIHSDKGADKGNKALLDLPPVASLGERVFQIYGVDLAGELIPISCPLESYSIHGLVSKPPLTFKGKENQLFFVNRRPVRNPSLSHAVQEAYRDLIPRDRHPVVLLFIDLDPGLVDVNVHPSKREIKFKENKYVHDRVLQAVRDSLQSRAKSQTSAYMLSGSSGDRHCEVAEGRNDASRHIVSHPTGARNDDTIEFLVREIEAGPSVRILGQIGALFIVAEIEGELHIIDQHAAHERVIYDRLKREYNNDGTEVQCLLIPETVDLNLDKAQILMEYIEPLGSLGFDIEAIGERSFMVRTIPAAFAGEDIRKMITDTIDEILEGDLSPGQDMKLLAIEDIMKALLSRNACHKAVRAKGLLSHGEMSSLLMDLLKTEMPYTCPHGRPVVRRFSSEELARMFDRK